MAVAGFLLSVLMNAASSQELPVDCVTRSRTFRLIDGSRPVGAYRAPCTLRRPGMCPWTGSPQVYLVRLPVLRSEDGTLAGRLNEIWRVGLPHLKGFLAAGTASPMEFTRQKWRPFATPYSVALFLQDSACQAYESLAIGEDA